MHCVKVSVFGVIQSECRKIRTRIISNTDTFHVVMLLIENFILEIINGISVRDKGVKRRPKVKYHCGIKNLFPIPLSHS